MKLVDYEKYYHSGSQFIIPRDEFEKIIEENQRLNNVLNELEKWLKMLPKYFMDKRSLNNGVYIEQGMQKQINLTLDKLKELKESDK